MTALLVEAQSIKVSALAYVPRPNAAKRQGSSFRSVLRGRREARTRGVKTGTGLVASCCSVQFVVLLNYENFTIEIHRAT